MESTLPESTLPGRQSRTALTVAALGVVYGDIGTSPLYTMKEVFSSEHGVPLDTHHLIGAVSVIFWGLMFVVTLKYVVLVLRADNGGEGGIMALTALASKAAGTTRRRKVALLLLGVFGGALFYGDSVITPAISVLSAVEGLTVVTPALEPLVLPVSIGLLIALFSVQRFGTSVVGALFGPVLGVWFLVLAAAGLNQVLQQPAILASLNPARALEFLTGQGWHVFVVLGAVVLAFTGAEALYADLGHFGKRPIRLAWVGFVFPSLALNYMGQGALLMRDPLALENPFFHLFPAALLVPAVMLATVASIIASQAVITGAYSMTKQAIQLGLLPRMQIVYTSAKAIGQIYLPLVNWLLLAAVVFAVVGFGDSTALASAYGTAVTATMLTTTLLTFFVVRHDWRYPLAVAVGATGIFLSIDILLVIGCLMKFFQGGWFPLTLGLVLFTTMASWRRGRELLVENIDAADPPLVPFLQTLAAENINRARRTAVYAVPSTSTVPRALLHNLKHNQVLHERNLILTVAFHAVPWVAPGERVSIEPLAPGFWRVQVNYGFKDSPDIPLALSACKSAELPLDLFETTYFLSRETIVPVEKAGMSRWREGLFAFMARNAGNIADFLRLPNNCVIELGTRVQI
jgi:KUP system potassium uptake protein